MTDEQIKKITRRARHFFLGGPFERHVDDLVQEVLMTFIQNRESKQSVKQACIDTTRRIFGDRRCLKHSDLKLRIRSVPDILTYEKPDRDDRDECLDVKITLESVKPHLTPLQYSFAWKYCFEGYSMSDLAREAGCTDQNVSQVFKTIRRALKQSSMAHQTPKTVVPKRKRVVRETNLCR